MGNIWCASIWVFAAHFVVDAPIKGLFLVNKLLEIGVNFAESLIKSLYGSRLFFLSILALKILNLICFNNMRKRLAEKLLRRKGFFQLGYMRTEIYNLYLDDPVYEHEYTAKTKRKFRIKEALAITDALKSITLDGLILLTSKYHNFYELHAAISAFSNGGEERDLHIFESIQQSYYTLRYSLPVKRTCHPGGNPLPICSYVYLMAALAEVLFGIELPHPERRVTMRQYLALLHETCKRKESEREAV